jgi:hypothetical protein
MIVELFEAGRISSASPPSSLSAWGCVALSIFEFLRMGCRFRMYYGLMVLHCMALGIGVCNIK